MTRELRITLGIMTAVLVLAAPAIFATPSAVPANYSYLSAVFRLVPTPTLTPVPTATPVPTPVPPDMSTLVIQLSEMASGYVRDEWHAISNADAAKTYRDPKATAAAFVAQGRETSWYGAYSSADYPFSDALGVSEQLYRYLTPEGAATGQAYTLAEAQRDRPDFRPFNISTPCCPTVGLRRTFRSGDFYLDQFLISVRIGRYVLEVNSIGISGYFDVDGAIYYTQLAIDHVYPVPQVMQVADAPAPASAPQPDTIDAALSPH
jgi:hypothetical protein